MKWIVVLLSLFSLYQGTHPSANGCPKGWSGFPGDNRCYLIGTNPETFESATELCTKANAELAPPLTCAQQVDLDEILTTYRARCRGPMECDEFWIGIHKTTNSSDWQTTKGITIGNGPQCQHWAKRFPKEDYGSCVVMSYKESVRRRGAWRNTDCTRTAKYICITCPKGFHYMSEVNECIKFIAKKETWLEARMSCTKLARGAQLLTIQDVEKQSAVVKYVNNEVLTSNELEKCVFSWWFGAGKILWMGGQTTDPDKCGSPYVWKPVAAPQIPFAYTNWVSGAPNCGVKGENCVVFTTAPSFYNRWEDAICDTPFCYICEF